MSSLRLPGGIRIRRQMMHATDEIRHLPHLLVLQHALPPSHAGIADAVANRDERFLRRQHMLMLLAPELRHARIEIVRAPLAVGIRAAGSRRSCRETASSRQ